MATSSLLKTILNKSVADGIYNEIMSRYSRYYYFLGRTLTWEDELTPPYPTDSYAYELNTRDEMITLKEVKPTDVSYVIPRYDWTSGQVYDQYDDQYSTEVQGLNLISGGLSYATAPNIYIGSTGSTTWTSSTNYLSGSMIGYNGNYYIITNTGLSDSVNPPTHTSGSELNGSATLKWVSVNDGNGSGATATCTVLDGQVIDIQVTHRGTGYTSVPSVIIAGSSGANAMADAVVTISPSGKQKLENCIFYVVTDEFNVYKCLDNNLNAVSTVKPSGTTVDPVFLSDGYMWKFLYNIPIALRNKFLTDQYIPVVTALRNQFYSNGALQTIRIDKAGSGYTSGSILVQGDGYNSTDPIYLTNYTLSNAGSSYTTPVTITVDPPITGVSQWQASSLVLVGQNIQSGNNVYKVVISGVTGSVAPVHRFGTVSDGAAALQYAGTVPVGTATLSGGAIDTITFYGMLKEIEMVGGGSGYTSVPSVNFSGGAGSNATASAVLANGSVIRVIINDPGTGYTSDPTVTFGTVWTASTVFTIGQQIYYSNRLYTVTAATGDSKSGSSAPIHTGGTQSNGNVTLTYAGVPATAIATIKYGSGYSSYPSVTIHGGDFGVDGNVYFTGSKSEAKLIPIFDGGALVGVQIDDPGQGYSNANLTIQGDGNDAAISADLSPGDVNTLQANIELLTPDGRIMCIPVISGGYGYGGAPTITINGDGTGATATATVINGSVTKINMTSYGQGYRWATVTITGTGFGAKARVIIAPFGGHGKNALTNLFTRYLMFYSNMAQDKNQGFDVNNDYRQLGIVKNPRMYGSTYNYTSTSGSACWVVSGIANTTLFPADASLTKVDDSTKFRIVTNNGNALLLQSLDNSRPTIGSVFVNDNGDLFTASAVTAPTVDKYSGDMLFIDNRAAFTPTADQTVTMRTVIKF